MIDLNKGFGKAFGISIISSAIFLIIGLFLLIKPDATISIVATTIGIFFILVGFNSIMKYFRNRDSYNFLKLDLTLGIISTVLGCVLIYNSVTVVSILPFILGIYFITNSITKIQYALDLKKYNSNKWIQSLVLAVTTLLFGILFVFNPFKGAQIITQIIGGFIVVYSITDIINYFLLKKNFDNVIKIIK